MGQSPVSYLEAIRVLDGVFDQCSEVIAWLDAEDHWSRSRCLDGEHERRTSSTAMISMMSFRNPDVAHAMNKAVWRELDLYAQDWGFRFSNVEDVSVQRYEPGQHYGLHCDASGPVHNRIVSAVLYLNTVDEGGETYFPYVDQSVSPVEGRLAIFPSNYVYAHEALTPVSGMKYAAAFWAQA